MTSFAQILSRLLEEKAITVNELARYTSIDRSSVYKMVKGTRRPAGRKMVEQIADQLTLTDRERSDLIDSYYLSVLGERYYYGWKQITEMFNRIAQDKKLKNLPFRVISEQPHKGTTVLNNQEDIINAVFSICAMEGHKKDGAIRIFTSSYAILSMNMIHRICGAYPDTKIIHVTALDNSRKPDANNRLYNIDCLCSILPLVVRHSNYRLRNLYLNIHALSDINMQISEMVITDEYVCIFDPRLRHGFLIMNHEVRTVYQDIFQTLYSMSSLLATRFPPGDMFDFIQDSDRKNFRPGHSGDILAEYIFSPGICAVQLLDEKETLSRDHLKLPEPDREIFIKKFHRYLGQRRQFLPDQENGRQVISTKQGVEYFINTGCINEMSPEITEPLSLGERLDIMLRWKKCYQQGGFYMIDFPSLRRNSQVCMISGIHHTLMQFSGINGSFVFVKILEPEIVTFFHWYCEFLLREFQMEETEVLDFFGRCERDLRDGIDAAGNDS